MPIALVPTASSPQAAKIFVVHGHDRDTRDDLELVLRRLGLEPFILQNADGGSKTIIEALEQNIYRDAAFGVVLLTTTGMQRRSPTLIASPALARM